MPLNFALQIPGQQSCCFFQAWSYDELMSLSNDWQWLRQAYLNMVGQTLTWTSFAAQSTTGWHVYTQNLWSFLDVTFSAIFGIYLVLRLHSWRTRRIEPAQQAMDVLAMGAPVLIPRIAFNLMSENMLFVSLRAMMRDFTVLTCLACVGWVAESPTLHSINLIWGL